MWEGPARDRAVAALRDAVPCSTRMTRCGWPVCNASSEAFRATGGVLQPGQLLSVYPPYCVDGADVSRSRHCGR
jgi:hypothetical protein